MANLEKTIPSSSANNLDIARYTANTECIRNVSATIGGGITWMSGVSTDDSKITIGTVSANTNSESRSGTVIVSYVPGQEESGCTQEIIVTQQGSSCNCNSLMLVKVIPIPNEGAASDTEILTYTSSTNCDVSFSCRTLEGGIRTVVNDIPVGYQYHALLNNSISGNTQSGSVKHNVTITVNGNNCGTQEVEQLGTNCSCESIISRFVYTDGILGPNGTGNVKKMIMSADTQGCGVVELIDVGGDASEMFVPDSAGTLATLEQDGDYVYIYADVSGFTRQSISFRSAVLNFKISTTKGGTVSCENKSIQVFQCSDANLNCNNLNQMFCTSTSHTVTTYSTNGSRTSPDYICFNDAPCSATTGVGAYYYVVPKLTEEQSSRFGYYYDYKPLYGTTNGYIQFYPLSGTLQDLCNNEIKETFVLETYISHVANNRDAPKIESCEDKEIEVTFKQISCENGNAIGYDDTATNIYPGTGGSIDHYILMPCCNYSAEISGYTPAAYTGIFSTSINDGKLTVSAIQNPYQEEVSATVHVNISCEDGDCYHDFGVKILPSTRSCVCNDNISLSNPISGYSTSAIIVGIGHLNICTIDKVKFVSSGSVETYPLLNITGYTPELGIGYIRFDIGDAMNLGDIDEKAEVILEINDCPVQTIITREHYTFDCNNFIPNASSELSNGCKMITSDVTAGVDSDILKITLPLGSYDSQDQNSCISSITVKAEQGEQIFDNYGPTGPVQEADKIVWTYKVNPKSQYIGTEFSLNIKMKLNDNTEVSTTTQKYRIVQ